MPHAAEPPLEPWVGDLKPPGKQGGFKGAGTI